jgi:hypothetical protein
VPGPVDLGPHRLDLSITGPDDGPLAATVFIEVDNLANSFTADESGHLAARLHPGRHRLTVKHGGHETRHLFVDVEGDLDLDVQIEEAPE